MSSEILNLKYKIIEKNDDFHTITVRYWTDILTEEDLRWSPNNLSDGSPDRCKTDIAIMLTGIIIRSEEDLHDKIIQSAPLDLIKNEQLKKTNNIDTSFINGLLHKVHEKELDITPPSIQQGQSGELSDEEIEKLLEQITNKK